MCQCTGPVWRALCVSVVCAIYFVTQVSAAAVGNVTTPKLDLKNVELNASDSRTVYQTAATPRRPTDAVSSAAQVGFYKADIPGSGIPSGLRGNRKSSENGEVGQRSRLRAATRPSADFYEEDAETLDEEELKGKGQGRSGSRRHPGSQDEPADGPVFRPYSGGESEDGLGRSRSTERRVPPPSRPRAGYKPFGGSEVVPAPSKAAKEEYKSDDEEASEYEEPSGSYSNAGDHDDYKEDVAAAEDEDESGHHAEEADDGSSGSSKIHEDESEGESDPGHHEISSDLSKDDLSSKLEDKPTDDIKPVVEDTGDHSSHASHVSDDGSGGHASESLNAPLHHKHGGGVKDHHFVKKGEAKHKSEHHSTVGEKGAKGYKKKQAHASGEAGKHGEESHKAQHQEKKGHKDSKLDEAGKYAEKHEAGKGKTGAQFADNGKHKKGHSTKGFRKVHRKDEFKKDETFYDESDNQGHHSKKGAAEKTHQGKKGEKNEKKHHDSKLDEVKAQKEGEKGHGSHDVAKKGHKSVEKEEAQHLAKSKGSKESGQKAVHKVAHAGSGHHNDY